MSTIRYVLIAAAVAIGVSGCSDTRQTPTAPSALNVETPTAAGQPPQTVSWECGRIATAETTSTNGWVFTTSAPEVSCPGGSRVVVQDVGVGVGQVTIAPGNLRATVNGTNVRLDWDPVLEQVTTYLVQAGSAPGLTNLANLFTGSSAASISASGVPPGQYYVRVRGVGPDNIPGPPSNEILVTVGGGGCVIPGAPVSLTQQVTNNTVNLSWQPPVTGSPVVSYIAEAGSSPGQNNIVVFDTNSAATSLTAVAPNGTYFVRVRARNACGAGPASNEVTLQVPSGSTPPQPAPPITNLVPQVTVSAATVGAPAVISGPPPRPNAAVGPPLAVQPAPPVNDIERSFTLVSSQVFDSIVVTGDTVIASNSLRPAVAADGYILIRLASPQSSVTLTLRVGQSFTAQFAAALGSGPVGAYSNGAVNVPPATACTYTVTPTSVTVPSAGSSFAVTVATGPTCTWTPSTPSAFITSPTGTRTGPGTVNFTVASATAERTGSVVITYPGGSQTVSVRQVMVVSGSALTATLTWNTTADMDLHVIEPSGAHVYYASRTGPTARLDVDDTNGFGPENIFVNSAAAGTYQVYIVHFSGAAPTTSTIALTLGGQTVTFSRTTTAAASGTGINVASVNIQTGQITPATGTRLADERGLTAPKSQ